VAEEVLVEHVYRRPLTMPLSAAPVSPLAVWKRPHGLQRPRPELPVNGRGEPRVGEGLLDDGDGDATRILLEHALAVEDGFQRDIAPEPVAAQVVVVADGPLHQRADRRVASCALQGTELSDRDEPCGCRKLHP
jgi:hypothetical protein